MHSNKKFNRKSRSLPLLTATALVTALALSVSLSAQEQTQQLPRYSVTDLGTLGGTYGIAGGLSNTGWVEGWSLMPGDTTRHPFLWRNGEMIDLGTLGGPTADAGYRPNDWGDVGGASSNRRSRPLRGEFLRVGH